MSDVRYLVSGDCAVCVEFGNEISPEINEKIRAFKIAVEKEGIEGIVETVPTYRSLLVVYKPEVIRFGTQLLRIISPFYLVYCVHDTLGGALRGAGNGKVPMICTLVCLVGFRQLYLYVMAHFICNDVIPIAMSFPAGWLLSSTLVLIYFSRTKMTDTRLVDA